MGIVLQKWSPETRSPCWDLTHFFFFSQFIFDCCHHFFCRYMTNLQLVLRNQSLNTSITIMCYDCFFFTHFVRNFFFHWWYKLDSLLLKYSISDGFFFAMISMPVLKQCCKTIGFFGMVSHGGRCECAIKYDA